MILCYHCYCEFYTNQELINHIFLFHNDVKIFNCYDDDECSGSFLIFESFKRHRYKFYALDDRSKIGSSTLNLNNSDDYNPVNVDEFLTLSSTSQALIPGLNEDSSTTDINKIKSSD